MGVVHVRTTLLNFIRNWSSIETTAATSLGLIHHGQRAFKMVVDEDHVFVNASPVDPKPTGMGSPILCPNASTTKTLLEPLMQSRLLHRLMRRQRRGSPTDLARSAGKVYTPSVWGFKFASCLPSPSSPTNLSKDAFKHRLKPDFIERFNANGHGVSAVRMHATR